MTQDNRDFVNSLLMHDVENFSSSDLWTNRTLDVGHLKVLEQFMIDWSIVRKLMFGVQLDQWVPPTPPFNDNGEALTVNAEWHIQMLTDYLIPNYSNVRLMWETCGFNKMGPLPTQLWHIISRFGDVLWPSQSSVFESVRLFPMGIFKRRSVLSHIARYWRDENQDLPGGLQHH